MTPAPIWTAREWGPLPERGWPPRHWLAERMTIGDETWFARLAPEGEPGLPPLLMLHGMVVSGAYFRPVATCLDRRYPLFIPDLPGYGRSSSARITSLRESAAHLARWMEAHALAGAVIVANSLGCQIATWLAVDRPELVAGLVLVAPTTDPRAHGPLGLLLHGALDVPRERQSLWRIWIPDLVRSGIPRALAALAMSGADDQRDRLPQVVQPTLIVGGERDPIAPPWWVREMAELMPRARALILPGSPHAMNYSRPRDLARAIDTAVTGHVKA